ncbi:MAG: hypothetical protein MUC36_13480 [Planctomycetes bacterium]|jgi:hypothetical protein|nr:hypothetical protein [Planctomycetota bacterium]
MRIVPTTSAFAGLLFLAAGCSGGSSDSTGVASLRCLGGQSFCIISCDLGCTQTGCAMTEIAENQVLRFNFSSAVLPSSVNGSSISIRTASGVAPDGELLVNGREVVFEPRVRTINGVSTFGFQRNESYIITLAGGNSAAQGVRGLSGETLSQEFTCTVRASLGIRDEDQLPPSVELLSPVNRDQAPLDPVIVLRFSELIDTTALQTSLSSASPIQVVLRGSLATGECDRDAQGITLEGVPQLSTEQVGGREVTVVTFQPSVTLPSRSCVTVNVTRELRDLSGQPAVPASFEFRTAQGVANPISLVETFATPAGQDSLISGGIWNGGARPGFIGGDGRHGSFSPQLGTPLGAQVFEWNTDSFPIPGSNTLNGQPYLVTDGKFYFTDFVLPAGFTLRFTGTVPPQIFVRGTADIRGSIQLNGGDLPFFIPTIGSAVGQRCSTFNARNNVLTTPLPGQPGSTGVCGGGRGGTGGNKCLGAGPIIVNGVNLTDGQPGETVSLQAGHAYAGLAGGTGGNGSPLTPALGTSVAAGTPLIISIYRSLFSLGGGGGGFMLPGQLPTVPTIAASTQQPVGSPAPVAAVAFPLLPYPSSPPPGYSSLNHFLVGGSGGGGGGCHPFGTIGTVSTDVFVAGSGGSAGGGAMAIRAGGSLTVGTTAVLQARGGAGVLINGDNPATATVQESSFGVSSPGGGGSGGSFLLQAGRDLSVSGVIDTSGGAGSRTGSVTPTAINVIQQAGRGSNGFYRVEAGGPINFVTVPGTVPTFVQADNAGTLLDRDGLVGDASTWRSSGQVFPPTWLRYELDVDENGDGTIDTVYTDSGAAGTLKANDPNGPVIIMFQGANLNQAGTEPLTGTIGQWREGIGNGAGPGISIDSVTGFRFMLIYNRAAFPNVVVRGLRVFATT